MEGEAVRCCFCSKRPILAIVSVTDGQVTVHIKVYKQGKIYAETFIERPERISLRCRECGRLQTLQVVRGAPQLVETESPPDARR
jgi:hypothetical protein